MKRWGAYLPGLLAVVIAWGVQAAIGGNFGPVFAFAPFVMAVLIAAWTGGLRPALLTMLLGYLIVVYVYVNPGTIYVYRRDNVAGAVVYLLLGSSTGVLAEWLHREKRRAEAAREHLRITLASIGDAVITTDQRGRIRSLNPIAESLTEWTLQEAIGKQLREVFRILDEDTGQVGECPAAKVLRTGHLVGLDDRTLLVTKTGKRIPIDDSAAPIYGNRSQLAGVILVFRDVRQRRMAEKRLQTQYAIARTLTETTDPPVALSEILHAVCTRLDWDVGAFWRLESDEGPLRCFTCWRRSEEDFAEFFQATREQALDRGAGPAGRAWETGRPCWLTDVPVQATGARAEAAAAEGIHTGFAVPVAVGQRLWGVMEFVSTTVRAPDEELLGTMRAVGNQIGQYLEHHAAERALAESAARTTAILETSLDCIITVDHQGRIIEFNPASERVFGYRRSEALGQMLAELILPPSLRDRYLRALTRIIEAGEGHLLGRRLKLIAMRRDGEEFPVELAVTQITVKDPPLFTAYIRDLSEQYQVERERRENEKRNRLLAELTSDFTTASTIDPRGHLVLDYASAGFESVTGYTVGELNQVGGWPTLFLPEDKSVWSGVLDNLLAGRECSTDIRIKSKRGEIRWIRSLLHPVIDPQQKRVTRVYAASQDVTERRQAEESLKLNARVLESMSEGVSVVDEQGVIVFTNLAEDRMFGYEPGELLGQQVAVLSAASSVEYRGMIAGIWQQLKATGSWSGEWQNRRKDGTEFTTHAHITTLSMEGRQYFVCVQRDVTRELQAQAALRASEQQAQERLALLDHVYSTAPVGMGLVDRELRYVRINDRLAAIDGKTPAACLGRTLREMVPQLADRLEPLYRHVLESGEPLVNQEICGATAGHPNEDRYWLVSYYPVMGVDGKTIGVSSIVLDITERKRSEQALRASEERFRMMADSAPVMIWLADTEQAFTWVNRPWLDYTGHTMEQELGAGWTEGIHRKDLNRCQRAFARAFAAQTSFRLEFRLRRHDGRYRWIVNHGVPLTGPEGQFTGYIGSVIDIHEHRQAEAALRAADERKNEFIAMLAHELRNPLAAIRYANQISSLPETAAREGLNPVEMIEHEVGHLSRLIDDLLNISRVMRGKVALQRQWLDAREVAAQAASGMRPRFRDKQQELRVALGDQPLPLLADPTRLQQVLENLLTNASKYSPPGATTWFTASRDHNEVVLVVRDNGQGIPREQIDEIFEPFAQLDPTLDRSEGGLGIGLTLVRLLVRMHHGTVTVESDGPGQGATFTIRIPIAEPAELAAGETDAKLREAPLVDAAGPVQLQPASTASADCDPAAYTAKEGGTRNAAPSLVRVLIVEDNQAAALGLSLLLKNYGHTVCVAYDGPSALATAPDFAPHVAILDIGLPGMSGYDVARAMRQQDCLKDTVLIALTGYGAERDRRATRKAGFDHHLVKPLEMQRLLELLSNPAQDES